MPMFSKQDWSLNQKCEIQWLDWWLICIIKIKNNYKKLKYI